MLGRIRNEKKTLKGEIYKTDKPQKFMAVLSQVTKNIDKYQAIVKEMNMPKKDTDLNIIYIHEIYNGNIRVKKELKEKLDLLRKKFECVEQKDKITYFRVFDEEILKTIDYESTNIKGVYKTSSSLAKHILESNEKIIIQNYSSCLPAIILNPEINSKIIDCCAAPGNKSIHLSNLMKNTGKIFAYERNNERFELLRQMLRKYKCKNVKPICQDFLDVKTIKNIDYILVDPSCSGSGIHDFYTKCQSRIDMLANFQKRILLHAMSFKGVKKIVYSTCSIHKEENEDVVKYVLENNKDFILEKINLPEINNNTNSDCEFSDKVIRIEKNYKINTNGFFIALFVSINNKK